MNTATDNYLRKLSPSQVSELRKRSRAGEKQTALAAFFGLSQSSVSRIVRRLSWKALT